MDDFLSRTSLRVIAPLALAVFAMALLLVVVTTAGGGSSQSPSQSSLEKQRDLGIGRFAQDQPQTAAAPPAASGSTYQVKSGDTLGVIAQRNGLTISQLEQLNPGLNPQRLISGEKIKLR